MIDQAYPSDYLRGGPSDIDVELAESCGTDVDAAVPFWMLARVASRAHGVSTWAAAVAPWTASRRKGERRLRRWVLAGATFAVANLGGLVVFLYHRADAMAEQQRSIGAEQERAAELARDLQRYRDATEETIRELRLDVRELRAAMRKITGVDQNVPGQHGALLPAPSEFAFTVPRSPLMCRVGQLDLLPGS